MYDVFCVCALLSTVFSLGYTNDVTLEPSPKMMLCFLSRCPRKTIHLMGYGMLQVWNHMESMPAAPRH